MKIVLLILYKNVCEALSAQRTVAWTRSSSARRRWQRKTKPIFIAISTSSYSSGRNIKYRGEKNKNRGYFKWRRNKKIEGISSGGAIYFQAIYLRLNIEYTFWKIPVFFFTVTLSVRGNVYLCLNSAWQRTVGASAGSRPVLSSTGIRKWKEVLIRK